MPRLFGHGPEHETFEHLAHKVKAATSCLLHIKINTMVNLSLFAHSLTAVQTPDEVHNVKFVAVLSTDGQVTAS